MVRMRPSSTFRRRSYWIPGSYAPVLSEKRNSFLSLLKNKGFKEERMTKVGLYAIGKSTTLESNKSQAGMRVIAAFFGPCAPWALTSHGSIFSAYFKR